MKFIEEFKPSGSTLTELVGDTTLHEVIETLSLHHEMIEEKMDFGLARLLSPAVSPAEIQRAHLPVLQKLRMMKELVHLPRFAKRINAGERNPGELISELSIGYTHGKLLLDQFNVIGWESAGINWSPPGCPESEKHYQFKEVIDDEDGGFIQDVAEYLWYLNIKVEELLLQEQ